MIWVKGIPKLSEVWYWCRFKSSLESSNSEKMILPVYIDSKRTFCIGGPTSIGVREEYLANWLVEPEWSDHPIPLPDTN